MKGYVPRTSLCTQCPCLRSRVQSKRAFCLNDRPMSEFFLALSRPLSSPLSEPTPLSTRRDMTCQSILVLSFMTGLIYKYFFASH